jgi:hypothetical protein
MIDSDFSKLSKMLDAVSEYLQKEPLSTMAMKMYFQTLKDHSIEDIQVGVTAHLKDPKAGQFYPKAADIIKHIEGGEITADMVIAAAKLADTPMGCLARIHIGTWDLNNQDAFYLRQRATECLQLMPQWRQKAKMGNYSDHDISVMLKYNVNPAAPFAFGLAEPDNKSLLIERASRIKESPRHLSFINPAHTENDKTGVMATDTKKLTIGE